jgi:cell fate regulator YaaT (PSP1 superfamily)
VQKGMEISISKRELFENYNQVVEKLNEIIRGVSSKSIEQWNDTKTKTLNLYHSVLNRIKEKEIEIRTEYTKEFRPLSRVA